MLFSANGEPSERKQRASDHEYNTYSPQVMAHDDKQPFKRCLIISGLNKNWCTHSRSTAQNITWMNLKELALNKSIDKDQSL
ncbi:hypothetical protein GCM10010965_19730 [Caldalkalibacillus thermarum]|nr:hypothetical protein GCM10010965_19730 [Caldalkalibacillus thermarum]